MHLKTSFSKAVMRLVLRTMEWHEQAHLEVMILS